MSKEQTEKKCIAIHLPVDLFDKINNHKAKTGKSQSGLLIDFIEKGLSLSQKEKTEDGILFFVKVRIDEAKMLEMGQKLQTGELDTSLIIMTYCIKDDPAVGMSFWKVADQKRFEEVFSKFRPYYKEVMEIIPVVTPMDSMKMIMETMKEQ